MLIDGEKRGSFASDVIGEDYREFCDSIVEEIPHMDGKEKALVLVRDTLPALVVLLMIWCAGRLAEVIAGVLPSFYCPVTLGNLLGGILLLAGAEGLITLLTKNAFTDAELLIKNGRWYWLLFSLRRSVPIICSLIKYSVYIWERRQC